MQVLVHQFQKLTMYFHPKVIQLHYLWVCLIKGLAASPQYCLLHLMRRTCQLAFVLMVPELDSNLVQQIALEVQSLFSVH